MREAGRDVWRFQPQRPYRPSVGHTRGPNWGALQTPFATTSLASRAATAWWRAKLTPITLHEGRHPVDCRGREREALSSYMGHSMTITFDRYGHLMPGNEAEAAGLLDAFLVRSKDATGASAGAQTPVGQEIPAYRRVPA
jgi:hypothetical protein